MGHTLDPAIHQKTAVENTQRDSLQPQIRKLLAQEDARKLADLLLKHPDCHQQLRKVLAP